MSSATNTSLRKAIDELGQALEVCFGNDHQSREAVSRLKETIQSIENRLSLSSLAPDELLNDTVLANNESFEPAALTDANTSNFKTPNTVAETVFSGQA